MTVCGRVNFRSELNLIMFRISVLGADIWIFLCTPERGRLAYSMSRDGNPTTCIGLHEVAIVSFESSGLPRWRSGRD